MSIGSLINRIRVERGAARRLAEVDNFLDNPSRLPDETVRNTIVNSAHIMGAPPPPKPLPTAGSNDIVLGAGEGALESLERQAAPNTPASLLSDAEGLMGLGPSLPRRRHPAGANPFTDPPLSAPLAPSGPVPTNLNIANMLSQLTPEDMARIHRGNVAASHPGASADLIDQLTQEGVGSGPVARLGALADDQKAFENLLESGSYRELFGSKRQLQGYRQDRAEALGVRQEEMLMDELTHPNAPYRDIASPRIATRQKEIAHEKLMRGEGYSDGYSEAAHTNANLSTATENLTEGASSGGTGMLTPATVQPSNNIMAALEGRGFAGMGASIGMGAVLGGTANYAMGGEFSEGAMMGGLAGGGIAIGARAVAANRESVSGFLQRQVLGDAATTDINANAALVRGMGEEEIGNLGFTQRAARSMLMQNPASPGLQSRHMVIGGSMLAGVAFTGRRNDRRRGFNAHRGNRI